MYHQRHQVRGCRQGSLPCGLLAAGSSHAFKHPKQHTRGQNGGRLSEAGRSGNFWHVPKIDPVQAEVEKMRRMMSVRTCPMFLRRNMAVGWCGILGSPWDLGCERGPPGFNPQHVWYCALPEAIDLQLGFWKPREGRGKASSRPLVTDVCDGGDVPSCHDHGVPRSNVRGHQEAGLRRSLHTSRN